MRPLLPSVVFCALLLAGCASSRIALDGYSGVYSTHFDGVPDTAAVCALLTNRGEVPVDWTQLRMRARSHLGETVGSWGSSWLYLGRIAPGETVAVELRNPPVADWIHLRLRRAGNGRPPRGRTATRADGCDDRALEDALAEADDGRTAPGRDFHPMDLHTGSGALREDPLVTR